ncbi:MAG: hypothetical protein PHH26_03880 [Candidatus Thermoplasmatota archaeon]|nr:hypothetical protein [Candidatus Thermoplasmatota archaeon]
MALVTGVTKKVEIPHEPGKWMELKRLSWRQLEAAAEIQTDILFERIKKMGSDIVAAFQKAGKEQEIDPLTKYDRGAVLQSGIVKWSYDAKVNEANIDSLDEETAEWAFREILSLNNPRTEEEQKNV